VVVAQIGCIIRSLSSSFHFPLVADKSAPRSTKSAIGASRSRGEPREGARFIVQREAIADNWGLSACLLLRKFPPIWKYARVSLREPRRPPMLGGTDRCGEYSIALFAQIQHHETVGAASLHHPQQLRRGEPDARRQTADHVRDAEPARGSTSQTVLELLQL